MPEGKSYNRRCVWAAGTHILLEQVDVWTPGGTSIDTSIDLFWTGTGFPPAGPVMVYRAGDCYVADDDYGTGSVNLTNRTASCISEQTGRVQQWQDTTASPRATMAEMYYNSLWWQIRLGLPFASQFTTDRHDNAAGLSWEVDSSTLQVFDPVTLTSSMIFTPEEFGLDTDGDGLPDSWEVSCYDADFDGDCEDGTGDVMLADMGADPGTRDLFLEVDWMERPGEFADHIWTSHISLRPTAQALRMVQEAFWNYQGGPDEECASLPGGCRINLHIDAGPSSVMDFPTGRTWDGLSHGGSVAYSTQEVVPVANGQDDWTGFQSAYLQGGGASFDPARRMVFRYAVAAAVPRAGSGGIAWAQGSAERDSDEPAFDLGGQHFVLGNNVSDDGVVARTLMHELGHTLGLGHGGGDHVNRKPNYLSIMSYAFQLDGLFPDGGADFSHTELATLHESAFFESAGIGGNAATGGLGTVYHCPNGRVIGVQNGLGPVFEPLAIDWNCDGTFSSTPVSVNLNGDLDANQGDIFGDLEGFDDWEHLVFRGGTIGALGLAAQEPSTLVPHYDELTLEEALEMNLAGHPGQGHVEGVVPFSVIAGEGGQELFVRVVNRSWSPGSWVLAASGELLEAPVELDVSIEGSTAHEFATQVVGLPLVADPRPGEYRVELELRGVFDSSTTVDVPVIAWSEEERANLLEAARSGELGVDQVVADQVIRVLAPQGTPDPGAPGGQGT
ncbi:MAG: hypothetical protein LBK95_09945, partial [Bifidobacteriaceae bacterium]|nr:hypothetical protein [Bifidobacteriaceae bacterium]